MIRFILFAAIASLAVPAFSQYPTIVGEWHAEDHPEDCGGPFAMQVGAMSYVEEGLSCSFDSVRRDGWQVTWNGSCHDGNNRTPVEFIALETDGRLTISINGNPGWKGYRRCNANFSIAPAEPSVQRTALNYRLASGAQSYIYWGDWIEEIETWDNKPAVPITVHIADAGPYRFASVSGGGMCGIGWECPIRIFKGDQMLGEFNACSDLSVHAVDSGRFYACEDSGMGREIASLIQ